VDERGKRKQEKTRKKNRVELQSKTVLATGYKNRNAVPNQQRGKKNEERFLQTREGEVRERHGGLEDIPIPQPR